MILGNKKTQLLAAERRCRVAGGGSAEKPVGQRILANRPAGAQIEFALGAQMRPAVSRSSLAVTPQPVTRLQHLGGFRIKVFENAAQKFAQDERIHDRGLVFGFDGHSAAHRRSHSLRRSTLSEKSIS